MDVNSSDVQCTSPGRGRAVQQQGEAHNNRLLLTLGTDGNSKMD